MFEQKQSKIFCIGCGKTGTTSMEAALSLLGFKMGDQAAGEFLLEDWARRDFRSIVEFCQTAEAFQDIPFGLDYTYVALDQAFPESKFILTVRNNPEEWYDSLTRFHTKLIGKNRLPTPDDLKSFGYRAPGWLWRAHVLIYGIDESSLYNRDIYIRHYVKHCTAVLDYFRNRADDLLVLNLAESSAIDRLCSFVNRPRNGLLMPHLNRSREAA